MTYTEVDRDQIKNQEVTRDDLNVSESTKAVITKVIAGTGISLSETGADVGTGDVTITATGIGKSDHAALSNLDYASAGHTGFSPDIHNHDATYLKLDTSNGPLTSILTLGNGALSGEIR